MQHNICGCKQSVRVSRKFIPTGRFRWVENLDSIGVLKYDDDIGYMLEADVEYPMTLARQQNELPFLPEKMKIGKV